MVPDVLHLRTALWKVKCGQHSRYLCVSSSPPSSLGSFSIVRLHQRLPVSRKLPGSSAAVWHKLSKSSGYGLKSPVLLPGLWLTASEVPSDSFFVSALALHKPLSHPILLLKWGFLNNEQKLKLRLFPSFQPQTVGSFPTLFCPEKNQRKLPAERKRVFSYLAYLVPCMRPSGICHTKRSLWLKIFSLTVAKSRCPQKVTGKDIPTGYLTQLMSQHLVPQGWWPQWGGGFLCTG